MRGEQKLGRRAYNDKTLVIYCCRMAKFRMIVDREGIAELLLSSNSGRLFRQDFLLQ